MFIALNNIAGTQNFCFFTFYSRYSKLRLFALKLKKKHNEILSQLEDTMKEKAKLEKIINENELTINKVDNVPASELQEQLSKFSAAVKEAEILKSELNKVKGNVKLVIKEDESFVLLLPLDLHASSGHFCYTVINNSI